MGGDGGELARARSTRARCATPFVRLPEVRAALERMWPVLTPAELLHDLFGSKALAQAGRHRSTSREDEYLSLHRPRRDDVHEVRWTVNDVALLDEARSYLGARPTPDGQRHRPGRRGRRDPHLRPHRHRRGAGPHPDAAADGRPPLAQREHDRRRRHRPGHRRAGAERLGRRAALPARPAPVTGDRPERRLPHPRPDHGAGQQGDDGGDAVAACPDAACASATSTRSSSTSPTAGLLDAVVAATRQMEAEIGDGNIAVVVPDSMFDRVSDVLEAAGVTHGRATRTGSRHGHHGGAGQRRQGPRARRRRRRRAGGDRRRGAAGSARPVRRAHPQHAAADRSSTREPLPPAMR